MMFSISLLLLAGAAALLYKILSILIGRRRRDAEAARRGCAPPPAIAKKDPLGISRLIEAARANREGRSPQWFTAIMDEVGADVHTIRGQIVDTEIIVSRDPLLAQFMFQTQSKDFEIGSRRAEIWSPLLGDAIFTAQGKSLILI
jgi:hypothetical protein